MEFKERLNFVKAPTIWEEQRKPREVVIQLIETGRALKIPTPKRPYQTYTAGPLFTTNQRKMIEEIATIAASKGIVPYIPHIQSEELTIKGPNRRQTVFQRDVKGVDTSDFITMWADYSMEPDPGTVWEQARAYTLSKPIIALREDFRNICRRIPTGQSVMNLMIEQSVDFIALNLNELAKAIDEVIKNLDKKQ